MNRPILGIIGGVGPLATAYFMEAIIKRTPADADQDNIPMIVFNDPQIPDRTAYILDHTRPNPQPAMVKAAKRLEDAGADYIAIACNTAHYFYDAICEAVNIPVLNIMEETARRIAHEIGTGGTVGLLATDGTIESGVFQSYLKAEGLETIEPDATDQRRVMSLIYQGVKANGPYDPKTLVQLAERLHEQCCDAVVVGCTELSVIYQDLDRRPPFLFDSLDILAERCVDAYERARKSHGNVQL